MSRDYVWVDAITGDVIDMETRIIFANATGTAQTRYSGTRSLTTDSYNGSYRLRATKNSTNISTFNMNHTGNYTSTDFTDNNANLVSLGYSNNDNAFWDGNKMTYGRGTSLPPLTTLDICAHEIGHGICQSTANLTYSGESGAINESLSDIWGACVENWATTNKQTWLCGEDLGTAFRSMSNPKLFGQPDTYGGTNWWNPTNLTWDNGGVHRNSGVMNYWFFLLSQGGNGSNVEMLIL